MAKWEGSNLVSKKYRCGHCGELVSSDIGFDAKMTMDAIYVCSNCDEPTVFLNNKQYPGSIYGSNIKEIPKNIEQIYNEARQSYSVNAFTASVMASRKLLMHIAVEKGAKEGATFQQYVDYLDANHFIPPDGKEWVNHIRQKGNEANHEIMIMKKEDAEDLIDFIEMLLKVIFEFPAKMKSKQQKQIT